MEAESLQPKLERAQKALQVALDEACGVDLKKVNTGELIRIEENLALAANAAKDAVSVRLKLRTQRTQQDTEREPERASEPVRQRVFDDLRGVRWYVYVVRPSDDTHEIVAVPEEYRPGWLVFDSANETRRVAPVPQGWEEFSIEELRRMCRGAPGTQKRHSGEKNQPPGPELA